MGTKRDIIESDLENGGSLEEHMHVERRKALCDKFKAEERRYRKGKKKRVPVWIKESILAYEKELQNLQVELLKLQKHVKEEGLKVLLIFEGRDAAGKGGTIKRITEHLNPRGARIVALNKPSDVEKTQWYFQRYVEHLPSAGEMVLFDRSWYNRSGVEPVMEFCSQEEHQEFLHEVPEFERMLVNAGITLIKFYFSISREVQAKRFKERRNNPLKHYKLSPIDIKAQELWDNYTVAEYSMLLASHTEHAPWTVIRADKKKKARLNCIKHLLNRIDYPTKTDSGKMATDPTLVQSGDAMIREMERALTAEPPKKGNSL